MEFEDLSKLQLRSNTEIIGENGVNEEVNEEVIEEVNEDENKTHETPKLYAVIKGNSNGRT